MKKQGKRGIRGIAVYVSLLSFIFEPLSAWWMLADKSEKSISPLRRRVHGFMLRLDEWFCQHLPFPPYYDLPDDADGWKMRRLLEAFALGKIPARYQNGLPVPRSLFFNRYAVLLVSDDKKAMRLISSPYGFFSAQKILVPSDTNDKLNAP